MTIFLPLNPTSPFPSSPSYLTSSSHPSATVKNVIKTILKARRVVVVCGAGVSVASGIPDFRSSNGLFQTLKQSNKDVLSSGKDLFDASVFSSEHTTSLFCQMIAQLSALSEAALPTAFHQALRILDDRSRLLRVYTQNIDCIEHKAGLSFGVPHFKDKQKPRSKDKITAGLLSQSCSESAATPPITPRCIPLHGTLQTIHCVTCMGTFPLGKYTTCLESGMLPECPECAAAESTRKLVGKRARGIGKLRPGVVLYNEDHKHAESVGEAVRRDLIGSSSKGSSRNGPDLLLVVGTSLRVPGTKRIVREFSKAVRHARFSKEQANAQLKTPSPSPRRSPATDEDLSMTSVYLNLDFPVPTREWDGVFDVWLQGDAQVFAMALLEEMRKEVKAKEEASEKKRKREELATQADCTEKQRVSCKKRTLSSSMPPSPCAELKKRRKRSNIPVDPPLDSIQTQKLYIRIPARHLSSHTVCHGGDALSMQYSSRSSTSPFNASLASSPVQVPITPPPSPPGKVKPSKYSSKQEFAASCSGSHLLEPDLVDNWLVRRLQCGLRSKPIG